MTRDQAEALVRDAAAADDGWQYAAGHPGPDEFQLLREVGRDLGYVVEVYMCDDVGSWVMAQPGLRATNPGRAPAEGSAGQVNDDRARQGDDLLSDMNAHAFELAQRLGSDEEDIWGFRCECGAGGCEETVLLSLPRYEEIRRRHEPILASGHSLTPPSSA